MTSAHDDGSLSGSGRAEQIEQQAAEWVTRIDLRGTPEEWAALDAWLAASPRHRAAFLRLSVAWRRADELKKLAPLDGAVDEDLLEPSRWNHPSDEDAMAARVVSLKDHLPQSQAKANEQRVAASAKASGSDDSGWSDARSYRARDEAEPSAHASLFRSLATSRLAAAAAVVTVALVAGGAWYAFERNKTDIYSTQIGEFHRVTLGDGSTVALNTSSEVRVRYTASGRHIELTRGEALFEVTHDTQRPFDVKASDTTVRAVGTAFSVRLHEEGRQDRVDVVVSEGRVAINPPWKQTYPAGSVAVVRNGRVRLATVSLEDITGKHMWTTGRLVFQGEKLSDVVAEINRYNQRKLLVTDPDIAGLRIGGTFQATDPDGFARALDRTFGIKSRVVTRSFSNDVIRLDSGVP
jgi:transmembrane sensor